MKESAEGIPIVRREIESLKQQLHEAEERFNDLESKLWDATAKWEKLSRTEMDEEEQTHVFSTVSKNYLRLQSMLDRQRELVAALKEKLALALSTDDWMQDHLDALPEEGLH